jgi:RNA polymerase sigma factor (sigma-70 family)
MSSIARAARPSDVPRPFRRARRPSSKGGIGRGLSAQQERELAARILAGDIQARDELVVGNQALAKYFAAVYLHWGRHDLSHEDLAQEGSIGLIKAANRYNPAEHGTRFSTYAGYWIKSCVRNACMNQGELIRIPVYLHDAGESDQFRVRIQHSLFCGPDIPVASDDPFGSMAQREERDRLNHELERLTAAQLELLRWYTENSMGAYGRRASGPRDEWRKRAAARRLIAALREKLNQEGSTNA